MKAREGEKGRMKRKGKSMGERGRVERKESGKRKEGKGWRMGRRE